MTASPDSPSKPPVGHAGGGPSSFSRVGIGIGWPPQSPSVLGSADECGDPGTARRVAKRAERSETLDCASIKTVAGTKVPPTAQHAIREATTAAINIAAAVRGGKRAEFGFEGLGTLGSLGHGAAVAQIFGVKISGLLAWCLWRCIYLMKMPGLNRKVRIVTDWLLHLLFPPELGQTKIAFACMSSRPVSARFSESRKGNRNS